MPFICQCPPVLPLPGIGPAGWQVTDTGRTRREQDKTLTKRKFFPASVRFYTFKKK